jgi:putative Mn2+ efflux pump MntP
MYGQNDGVCSFVGQTTSRKTGEAHFIKNHESFVSGLDNILSFILLVILTVVLLYAPFGKIED